jgi:hypothetical protein
VTLTLTPLPSNLSAKSLLPNTDPTTGVVTATVRPTRHAWAVGQTVLAAMGIRLDLIGAGRRHGENLELLNAWFSAYGVRLLVLRHATNTTDFDLLDEVLLVCESVGVDLALTCDDTAGQRLVDWVTERSGHVDVTHEPLLDRVANAARPVPGMRTDDSDDAFPMLLPRVDFYAFRARCRDVLTPAQFALVDALYVTTYQEVQSDPYGTAEEAAARITAAVTDTDHVGKALVVARAAQAAMFTHGLLLKVNLGYFLKGIQDAEHRRLTAAEIRSLRAYRNPWQSAAVVLRDADLSRDHITALRISNVTDDGHLAGVDHLPLSDDARVYLRAQRILRTIQGAAGDDPFITAPNRSIGQAQRRASVELNLPLVQAREPSDTTGRDRWKTSLGVTLLPLVTQHLPSADDIKNGATA